MIAITIDANSFQFSILISSASFRVVEVSQRWKATVDLKLNEAIWLVGVLNTLIREGYSTGRWSKQTFDGRTLYTTCKENRAGRFLDVGIFSAKGRTDTLIIPEVSCGEFPRNIAVPCAPGGDLNRNVGPSPFYSYSGRLF